eukprot:3915902-Pleurochrysis_carterae.AAC.1
MKNDTRQAQMRVLVHACAEKGKGPLSPVFRGVGLSSTARSRAHLAKSLPKTENIEHICSLLF